MRYDEEFNEALGEEVLQAEAAGQYAGKKKGIALLLVVLFGIVGIHDLYLDRIRRWSARLPLPLALVVLLNFTNVEGLFVQWTPQNIATVVVIGLMCLWWIADIIAILLMPAAAFDGGQDELADEEFVVAPPKEETRHVAPYPKTAETMLFADEDELGADEERFVKGSAREAQRVAPYPQGGDVALLADEDRVELREDDIMDALAEEPPIVVPEVVKKKREKPEKKKRAEKFVAAKADVPLEGAQPAVIVKLPEEESAAPKVVYVETRAKEVEEKAETEEPMAVPVPNMKTDSVLPPWRLHKKQQELETAGAPQNVLQNTAVDALAAEAQNATETRHEAGASGPEPRQAAEQPQGFDDSTLQEIYTAIDKFDVTPLQQKYSLSEREARAVLFLTHCTREFGQSEDIIRNMVQHYRLLPKETTRIVETFAKQQG